MNKNEQFLMEKIKTCEYRGIINGSFVRLSECKSLFQFEFMVISVWGEKKLISIYRNFYGGDYVIHKSK